jgi:hypothetical protein
MIFIQKSEKYNKIANPEKEILTFSPDTETKK